jgi:hypothetical protein
VGPVHTTGGHPHKYKTSFYVMEVTPFDEVVVSTPDKVYQLHCKKDLGDCDHLPAVNSTVLGRIFYHHTYPKYPKDGFVDLTYSPEPYPLFAHYTSSPLKRSDRQPHPNPHRIRPSEVFLFSGSGPRFSRGTSPGDAHRAIARSGVGLRVTRVAPASGRGCVILPQAD